MSAPARIRIGIGTSIHTLARRRGMAAHALNQLCGRFASWLALVSVIGIGGTLAALTVVAARHVVSRQNRPG